MEAVLQPGACWLVVVESQYTVLRIAPTPDRCLFHGESDEHPLTRVQEWLAPVWTPTMHQCSHCLTSIAERLGTHNHANRRRRSGVSSAPPQPQSFWIASIRGNPDVLQVVENGVRLPGRRETYPLQQVRLWIMPVWSPEMAYCTGCGQTKPRHDMLFFYRGSRKGVCKNCSEAFDVEAVFESNRI